MQQDEPRRVTAIRLTAAIAKRRVSELAKDTGNLLWTSHIRERMEQRGIESDDVLRILREGDVDGEPVPGKSSKEWKIKLVRRMRNGRHAGVVTLLINDQRLRLLTAEWEDLR